jgi:hydrogenase expression/formation protein HypD
MNYIDEYRERHSCRTVADEIAQISRKQISLMEVCGGHTMALYRFGIHSMLPPTIRLVSGPGCPVCVTATRYIDHCVALSRNPGIVLCTFGDLMRVPGSSTSLSVEKSRGADIQIVYSPLDALTIAQNNPSKKVVFAGIGFETTAPTTAAALKDAVKKNIDNFFILSAHKVMPPAMSALIDDGVKIDGYICPGHVSVVTGSKIYTPLAEKYGKACVVSGFEPLDILLSIFMLVKQIEHDSPSVEIEYRRAVTREGNRKAQKLIDDVYESRDDWWRGLGVIAHSGLGVRNTYRRFDAEAAFDVEIEPTKETKGCICGDILKGIKQTRECPLFDTLCTPSNPVGACMVSSEGACAAYYRYRSSDEK